MNDLLGSCYTDLKTLWQELDDIHDNTSFVWVLRSNIVHHQRFCTSANGKQNYNHHILSCPWRLLSGFNPRVNFRQVISWPNLDLAWLTLQIDSYNSSGGPKYHCFHITLQSRHNISPMEQLHISQKRQSAHSVLLCSRSHSLLAGCTVTSQKVTVIKPGNLTQTCLQACKVWESQQKQAEAGNMADWWCHQDGGPTWHSWWHCPWSPSSRWRRPRAGSCCLSCWGWCWLLVPGATSRRQCGPPRMSGGGLCSGPHREGVFRVKKVQALTRLWGCLVELKLESYCN